MMDDYLRKRLLKSQQAQKAKAEASAVALDEAGEIEADMGDQIVSEIRREAAAIVQGWVETEPEELGDGEGLVDRLYGMLAANIDRDEDGELSDDEALLFQTYIDAAWDYMLDKGVSDEDAGKLFDDEDEDAAQRVRDMLAGALPEGEEAALDDVYGFSMDAQRVALDAAGPASWARRHKGKMTLSSKHGKRKITQHRMKWRRATAAQRVALKKNARRAHTATAKARFIKSARLTRRMGGRRVI